MREVKFVHLADEGEVQDVAEGDILYFTVGESLMKVIKLYEYREFGTYAMLEGVHSSFGFSAPISQIRKSANNVKDMATLIL